MMCRFAAESCYWCVFVLLYSCILFSVTSIHWKALLRHVACLLFCRLVILSVP